MSRNKTNKYDVDPHVAEIYDSQENYADDVELIRNRMGKRESLRIPEPFCGTGRIVIPLALDGHRVVGLDRAKAMLDGAREEIRLLPHEAQSKTTLIRVNVLNTDSQKVLT